MASMNWGESSWKLPEIAGTFSPDNPNILILGDNEIKNVEKNEMIFIMFRNLLFWHNETLKKQTI